MKLEFKASVPYGWKKKNLQTSENSEARDGLMWEN